MIVTPCVGSSSMCSLRTSISGDILDRHESGTPRERVAAHSQRAPRRNRGLVRGGEDQGVEGAQLGLEHAHRSIGQVGAQRVGADQLGQAVCVMCGRAANRAHLVQDDRNASLRRLPRGL